MPRPLVITAVAVPLVMVLALAGIGILATTAGGTRWVLTQIENRLDGALSLGRVSGTLHEQLIVDEFVYANAKLRLRAARIALKWEPRALFRRHLLLNAIEIDSPVVDLLESHAAAEPAAAPSYPQLPVAITIERLTITGGRVRQGDTVQVVEQLQLVASADDKALSVNDFRVVSGAHRLAGHASLHAGSPLRLALDLDATAVVGEAPLQLDIEASGSLRALELSASLDGRWPLTVDGVFDLSGDLPAGELTAAVEPIDLGTAGSGPLTATLRGDGRSLTLALNGSVVSAGRRFPIVIRSDARLGRDAEPRLMADFDWRAALPQPWGELSGAGSLSVADGVVQLEHRSAAPFTGNQHLRFAGGDAPALDATVTLADVALPRSQGTLLALNASASGALSALVIAADATLDHAAAGRVDVLLALRREGPGWWLDGTRAQLLDGSVELGGKVASGEVTTGEVTLALQTLNPERLLPGFDASLSGNARTVFSLEDSGPKLRLVIEHLAGSWRGHVLAVAADLAYAGEQLTVDALSATVGDNRARFHGTLGETLDARFELGLTELAALAPGLAGKITAAGELAGSRLRPMITASLTGDALRYENYGVADLNGDIVLDLDGDTHSRVRLELNGIDPGDGELAQAVLVVDGLRRQHDIVLTASRDAQSLAVALGGALADDGWRGQVERLDLVPFADGLWRLIAPTTLSYVAERLTLEPLCLTGADDRICVSSPGWSATGGEAVVDARRVPLALLNPFLPTTVVLAGELNLAASVHQRDGELRAAGGIGIGDGRVTLPGDDAARVFGIEDFESHFDLTPTRVALNAAFDVDTLLSLDLRVTTDFDSGDLSGTLLASSDEVSWLEEFVPALAGSDASLRIEGAVSGTRERPTFDLGATLTGGALVMPASGTRVSRLDAHLAGSVFERLVLEATVGDGSWDAALDAEMRLSPEQAWRLQAHLRGEDIAVVRLPDVEADISPDLSISADPALVDVRGVLTLPRVAVRADGAIGGGGPAALRPSADAVIVGVDGAQESARQAPDFFVDQVTGEIDLRLGDAVTIDAVGLHARLAGALAWTKQRGEPYGSASGTIAIAEGGYEAYGQRLDVAEGRLQFGGPLDRPNLFLRAVRPNIDVLAGVAVSGAIASPSIDLYSNPAMPDAEILSYLITGRGLADAESGDANLISRAALSLGAEQASVVTSQVQHTFGLDQFDVNTGSTVRDTSLTAGKRLSPRLSVRSTFNPFDQLWAFFLNYKLTANWSVEAESGARQGADLIYSIESDKLIPEGCCNPLEWLD